MFIRVHNGCRLKSHCSCQTSPQLLRLLRSAMRKHCDFCKSNGQIWQRHCKRSTLCRYPQHEQQPLSHERDLTHQFSSRHGGRRSGSSDVGSYPRRSTTFPMGHHHCSCCAMVAVAMAGTLLGWGRRCFLQTLAVISFPNFTRLNGLV